MSEFHVAEDGTLTLALAEGESVRVIGGGHQLSLALAGDGTLTAAIGRPAAPEPLPTPPAPPEARLPAPAEAEETDGPLSAADAIDEIVNAFQQVNVKMRQARSHHHQDAHYENARDGLRGEAMDRVVAICRRYLLHRGA